MKRRIITAAALALFVALSFWLRLYRPPKAPQGQSSSELTKRVETEGSVERTEYVDAEGRLTYAQDKRWAYMLKTRDEDARTTLEEYFDENGAPAPLANGSCAVLKTYDANDKNIETAYLDAQGRPVDITSGYARVTRTFDALGRQTSEHYFSAQGRPAVSTNGAHGYLREYPDDGKDYRMTYLGKDNRPVVVTSGYAAVSRTLNEAGKVVEERYFDVDGAPCPLPNGEYGFRKTYDADGHETEVTYIDMDGAPTMTQRGYAIVKKTYDDEGRLSAQMYYDAQGRPKAQPRGHYGTGYRNGKSYPLNASGGWKLDVNHILRTYPITVILCGLVVTLLSALLSRRMNLPLLALYLLFIAYMTLMYRNEVGDRLNLDLFWSYRLSLASHTMRGDILDNIWLFIPLGAILYRLFGDPRALLIPLALSVGVEITQFIFSIGLCELDDVFNNTLGGCIGWLMGMTLRPRPHGHGNGDAMNGVPAAGDP